MSDLKALFVSYEIAKQLKEKGFNEVTMWCYNPDKDVLFVPYNTGDLNSNRHFKWQQEDKPFNPISAPLFQQVVDWLREEHMIKILENENFISSLDFVDYSVKRAGGRKEGRYTLTAAIQHALTLIK